MSGRHWSLRLVDPISFGLTMLCYYIRQLVLRDCGSREARTIIVLDAASLPRFVQS
jgi:hypothetical protein